MKKLIDERIKFNEIPELEMILGGVTGAGMAGGLQFLAYHLSHMAGTGS